MKKKTTNIFEQRVELFNNMKREGIYFSTEWALRNILKFDDKQILRIKRKDKLKRILNGRK